MDYIAKYQKWLKSSFLSAEDKNELLSISENKEEIQDRFYKELEFGTAGLRGKIGMGTNRMNIYTVGKTTQGLANYLLQNTESPQERGVAIAYDCRYKSREFSARAAQVLAANGIKVYLFEDIRPTPELSFAVYHLQAAAGIVITASHNPPEYNGYKVYAENAAQIMPETADKIIEEISKIKDDSAVKIISLQEAQNSSLLINIGADIDKIYYQKIKQLSLSEDIDKKVKIVFTPLHGTGNRPIREILESLNYENLSIVEEQAGPDPEFSTVDSPNPENPAAFKMAVKSGLKKNADILIATDPDCDRIAVAVFNPKNFEKCNDEANLFDTINNYVFLNGNQTGALLLNYILERRKENNQLPIGSFVIKTIVTSDLGKKVAEKYNIQIYDTLTGFKFICNKAMELEKKGGTFLFGYEESIGYLAGNFVKDKDAVICAMLIAEMAAYYKKRNLSLLDVLADLYGQYGYFLDHLESITLEGMAGELQMKKIMASFREQFPVIPGMDVAQKIDYLSSFQYDYLKKEQKLIDIPQEDVLKCFFTDGSWYAIRPSGTEPKIKIYMSLVGKDKKQSEEKLLKMKSVILQKINSILKYS